ncbi:sensor histidine kinase [Diaphorobacter caeni]|uniref:sensor histidine kinase n=1 Tax=Diaphorobacter caeni TaxID=2784387 RepID=UPI00188FF6D6|nr:sensor histidine kinase [Diaphorobacter caeni]MBF5003545.1 sensor histidine kinase [Diaphorobacter caeni]
MSDAVTLPTSSGSLRARLLIGSLAWIIVTLALAGWGLRNLFKEHIEQQLETQLVLHLNQLSAAVNMQSGGKIAVTPLASDTRFEQPLSGLYWQIDELGRDAQQRPQVTREAMARSRSLWDQVLAMPAAVQFATSSKNYSTLTLHDSENHTLLAVTRNLQLPDTDSPPLRLSVAADSALMTEPLQRFTSMLLLTLGVLALGLSIAVLIQLQLALQPLKLLRQRLSAVRNGDANTLEGRFPQELQPLVNEFNKVLHTNAEIVQRARTQAGNLAHAVNTPLSVLRNAAEQETGALARLVSEQASTAQRQIDHHLARARAASAARTSGLRTPVLAPLQALVRTMEKLHAERGLHFEMNDVPPELAFRGEEQDFFELMGNVIDNAGKWATSRVLIHAAHAQDPAMLEITVDDDGPGLSENERKLVFQRGRRLDEQRPGSGLGLDIVRDLAQTYGGEVQALESPLGGLRMRLLLPAGTQPSNI